VKPGRARPDQGEGQPKRAGQPGAQVMPWRHSLRAESRISIARVLFTPAGR
jgi:hypothetical protein